GRAAVIVDDSGAIKAHVIPTRRTLYREAFLTAATNPKAILFFTALFPQFVNAQAPMVPQFFILTGIFMVISYLTHLSYALLAARAKGFLLKPAMAKWMNRVVGAVFISFGSLLLALRRQAV
ncbi:MAG TPA: LysE family transporter, partial [Burkholderiaceae bacterium]|nr:LysE family transporter [Burkholderiaceae bacterium]